MLTAIDDLVLLREESFLAAKQFAQAQSHSGTPPMEAVPKNVISITYPYMGFD